MQPQLPVPEREAFFTGTGDQDTNRRIHSDSRALVADHELIQRIGAGAYGEVWLARSVLGQLRAVKLVYRSRFGDERPFQREFEGIQRFEPTSRSHPSQLAILHVGKNESAGYFYYVMELADGVGNSKSEIQSPKETQGPKPETGAADAQTPNSNRGVSSDFGTRSSDLYIPHTLRYDLEQHGRLPVRECVDIGMSLTTALSHLHQHGLVHRDIKPSNVLFVNGAPKLGDIGLVTQAGDTRSIVGTEGYIPPEGPGTPQADIFSLGIILYEASTGMDRRSFPELPQDLHSWADRHTVVEFNEILLKACAKDARRRYESTEELRKDLELLRVGKSLKRRRILKQLLSFSPKAGFAILLLALVVTSVFFLQRHPDTYAKSSIPEVNDLVVQGFACVKDPDRVGRARDFFNRAKKLDPKFVPAYWGLVDVAINSGGMERYVPSYWGRYASTNRAGGVKRYLQANQELHELADALARIAPGQAESLVAASCAKWGDWDFAGARTDAHRATQMRAACAESRAAALCLSGYYLLQSGRPEEALIEYETAERVDPASPNLHHHLGHPFYARGKLDEALKYYQQALQLQPGHAFAHCLIGRVYEDQGVTAASNGQSEESKGHFLAAIAEFEAGTSSSTNATHFYDALREAVRKGGAKGYWSKRLELAPPAESYCIATLYARLGDKATAYSWLRRACKDKVFDQGPLFDLCWDRSDPEFQAIMKGIGLLE